MKEQCRAIEDSGRFRPDLNAEWDSSYNEIWLYQGWEEYATHEGRRCVTTVSERIGEMECVKSENRVESVACGSIYLSISDGGRLDQQPGTRRQQE